VTEVNQEERARRLRAALREKEAELARRRATATVAPSQGRIQNVSAASLAAAAAAWMTGFPPKTTAALGPVGDALAGLADLQPLLLGLAVGCLFAGFWHWRVLSAREGDARLPQPAPVMLALSLLFLALNLLPVAA
jgi:hypothetical protein